VGLKLGAEVGRKLGIPEGAMVGAVGAIVVGTLGAEVAGVVVTSFSEFSPFAVSVLNTPISTTKNTAAAAQTAKMMPPTRSFLRCPPDWYTAIASTGSGLGPFGATSPAYPL
jgi:hypothetical protein